MKLTATNSECAQALEFKIGASESSPRNRAATRTGGAGRLPSAVAVGLGTDGNKVPESVQTSRRGEEG